MSEEAFIYEAIRTPRGKQRNGALNEVKPLNLVVGLVDELRRRFPDLDETLISDMILGVVSPVGDQGGDIARTAVLAARPARDHRRRAAQPVLRLGPGGRQHRRAEGALRLGRPGARRRRRVDEPRPDGLRRRRVGDRPRDQLPDRLRAAGHRRRPDRHHRGLLPRGRRPLRAAQSQEKAAEAWSGGYFAKSVVPVRDQNGLVILDHDEHMRPDTTLEGLGKLKTAFDGIGEMGGFDDVALQKYHWVEKINHVHTGGNSSGIVDGAALVLVGSEKAGKSQGLTPRARIVATATSGADPVIMLTGPTPATRKVLDRAGLTIDDIDLFELNEAFASVVLKFQKDLNIPDEKLNVNGGAIAMGHPLGATGAMITGTMVDELERRNARRALVTLCIGGGMGVATIIERV